MGLASEVVEVRERHQRKLEYFSSQLSHKISSLSSYPKYQIPKTSGTRCLRQPTNQTSRSLAADLCDNYSTDCHLVKAPSSITTTKKPSGALRRTNARARPDPPCASFSSVVSLLPHNERRRPAHRVLPARGVIRPSHTLGKCYQN
jgi:hypothetical protein